MTRLEISPDNRLIADIKSVLSSLQEIKQPQVVGASSLKLKRTLAADWDVNGATVSPASEDAKWRVTFTPEVDRAVFAQLDVKWLVTPEASYNNIVIYDDPSDTTISNQKSWIVGLIPNNNFGTNSYVYLRFAVRSASAGTYAITRLT